MNLLWKEQLQEAAVTSTSGQADVEAGVTEPRSLGKGPWSAETLPSGKGTVLGSGWHLWVLGRHCRDRDSNLWADMWRELHWDLSCCVSSGKTASWIQMLTEKNTEAALSYVSPSVLSDYKQHHGLWPSQLLCPWYSPGNNTRVGCHFLLWGTFLTHGFNPHVLHWQVDSLLLRLQGSHWWFYIYVKCIYYKDFPMGKIQKPQSSMDKQGHTVLHRTIFNDLW